MSSPAASCWRSTSARVIPNRCARASRRSSEFCDNRNVISFLALTRATHFPTQLPALNQLLGEDTERVTHTVPRPPKHGNVVRSESQLERLKLGIRLTTCEGVRGTCRVRMERPDTGLVCLVTHLAVVARIAPDLQVCALYLQRITVNWTILVAFGTSRLTQVRVRTDQHCWCAWLWVTHVRVGAGHGHGGASAARCVLHGSGCMGCWCLVCLRRCTAWCACEPTSAGCL